MLRALLVFVTAGSLSPAVLADEPFVEASSFDATSGDESGDAGNGLLPAGWSDPTCVDSCVPTESLLCDDCSELCGTDSPIRLRFGAPVWLSEIHGDAVVRGVPAAVNVTTRDMFEAIDDVNFAVVGRMEADAGRWGLFLDGGYVNLSAGRDFAGGRINLSQGVESAIVESFLTYDLLENEENPIDGSAELMAGARYWLLGGDVAVTGPRGNTVGTSGTRQWVDPVVGARFARPLNDDLLMRVRADVGGFGAASDFTWGVEALGEYRCSDYCGLQLGYRVLDVDYARGDGFAYDVNYRGPIAVLVFDF